MQAHAWQGEHNGQLQPGGRSYFTTKGRQQSAVFVPVRAIVKRLNEWNSTKKNATQKQGRAQRGSGAGACANGATSNSDAGVQVGEGAMESPFLDFEQYIRRPP
jgi:hypothetical protein